MLTTFIALAVTALLIEVARRLAPAVGLIDSPDERKAHEGEIPLVGGIAIFAGLVLVLAFRGMLAEHAAFFVSAGLLVLIGMWDDVFGVSPHPRVIFQGIAVLIMAFAGGVYIEDVGTLIPAVGTLSLGWMALPFTVFAGVGLINAFNMSDGVDGLCGTLTLIALVGLGIAAGLAGRESELLLILALSGGVIGFLSYNVRLPRRAQAKVFLGDAGSYLLGLSVLYLAVRLSQGSDRAIEPVTALWFCAVPLLDTIGMILRRLRRGKSPFSPDREHIHHLFLLADFSVTTTWLGLAAVSTAAMLIGLAGVVAGIPDSLMFASFLVIGVLYYGMIVRVWKVLRFFSRSINRRVMVKHDRRSGTDRRQRDVPLHVVGIAQDRRSGLDRRQGNLDRRNGSIEESSNVVSLQTDRKKHRPKEQAARVS
jgi:UDP-GlcNAc:undecaprenyl-phosphate GlcNAc-1-phosphate transferase